MAATTTMALSHVSILHWPQDAAAIEYLREHGSPRLLLVAADADAPSSSDPDEDWIRLPARHEDIRARASALEARSAARQLRLEVKGDGRVLFEGRWVALSHTEEALVQVLAQRFGEVVDPASLASALSDRRLSPTALRVHLTRLRKRIGPIGLVVRTVRSRGYVLDRDGPDGVFPDSSVSRSHSAAGRGRTHTRSGLYGRAGADLGHAQRRIRRPRSGWHNSVDTILTVGDLTIDGPRHQASVGGHRVELTPIEFALLGVLARRQGEVVEHQVLLEEVWGQGVEDTQYVRVYAAQIRKKLAELSSQTRLITQPRVGYRLVAQDSA